MPANTKLRYSSGNTGDAAIRKKKGKGKEGEDEDMEINKQREASQQKGLATLDIFAGCGGLSEGLQKAG